MKIVSKVARRPNPETGIIQYVLTYEVADLPELPADFVIKSFAITHMKYVWNLERRTLRSPNLIEAISAVRVMHPGMGLKEAKDLCEAVRAEWLKEVDWNGIPDPARQVE